MELLTKAKKLDDVVLGRSDSTRGFVVNATMGLHPLFAPWYFAIGTLLLPLTVVLIAMGHLDGAVGSLAGAVVCAAKGFASKRLPRHPER